jgi:hypothetical protein
MVTRSPAPTTVVFMKAMVLLAGQGRRLLRAALVGGLGSATAQSVPPAQADHLPEQQQDIRPDTGSTSRDELRAAKAGIRHG